MTDPTDKEPIRASAAFLATDGGGRLALPPENADSPDTAFLRGRRVVFAANTSWYLYNHRRSVLRAFAEAGADVVALTPADAYAERLTESGCRSVPLPMLPSSKSPLRELQSALGFRRAYRKLRPDLAFHYTIKCNLYGGAAAGALGIPHVNTVCGLGSAFEEGGGLNRLVRAAYRITQRKAAGVYFQSPSDFDRMRAENLVTEAQALLLPGSGVDLRRFAPAPSGNPPDAPVFVFVGRLLREKGLAELAEAMRRVRAKTPAATCRIYGFLEPSDPRFVTRAELAAWEAEGLLEYRGALDDVRPAYAAADCAVLPTYYREGVPKSLLEASAMGLPIVTTSLIGCRAVVRDGENGRLCEPRSPASLADALEAVIAAGPEGRASMGRAGRARAEEAFGEERVIRAYLEAARALLPDAPDSR